MKTYRVICSIKEASGTQSWLVLASSPEQALKKWKRGGKDVEFESEEIEVTELHEPEITENE